MAHFHGFTGGKNGGSYANIVREKYRELDGYKSDVDQSKSLENFDLVGRFKNADEVISYVENEFESVVGCEYMKQPKNMRDPNKGRKPLANLVVTLPRELFDAWTDGPTTKQVDWYDEKTDTVVKKEVGLKTYERNITPQMRENIKGFGSHVLDFLETQGFEKENILYGMVHMDEGTPHVEVGILCKTQSMQSVKGEDGKRVKGADGKYLKSMQDTISYGNAIPQKAKMRKFHENFDEYMSNVYGKKGLILTGATKGNKTAEEMREYREEQANINAQQVALRKAREDAENAKQNARLTVQAELKGVMDSVKAYSETVTAEVNAKSESVERTSETLITRTRELISSEVASMNIQKSELASSESAIFSTSEMLVNTSLSVTMVSENVENEKAVQTAYASELARTDERLSATASALATRSAEVEQKSLHADNVLKQAEKEKAEAQEHKAWVKTALERFSGLREKANSYLDSLKDWIKGEKEEEKKENKRIISIATAHIMDMEQSGALKSIADAVREEAQEHMDNLETVVSTDPNDIAIDPKQVETPEQAEELDFSQFEVKPKQNQRTF
ncbi:plasmid recombination protein [Streptococcus salivarius]|uniref:plasmid recombination protein n=1 Tax=Streptococcus salivarius TaxID=1304 RepID=UPI00352C3BAA